MSFVVGQQVCVIDAESEFCGEVGPVRSIKIRGMVDFYNVALPCVEGDVPFDASELEDAVVAEVRAGWEGVERDMRL